MNKAKKNIVIVGFKNEEKRCVSYPYIENSTVHYCDTISEAIKYQGYMIIINNIENINLVSFDKKYRKSLNKYERILIYNGKYTWTYDKWSRFEKVDRGIFDDYSYQLVKNGINIRLIKKMK